MIKSIFIKYILVFLIIITLSFVILAVTISASIVNYSIEAKQMSIVHTALVARQHINTSFKIAVEHIFEDFIERRKDSLSQELEEFTKFTEDALIFITDTKGEILLTTTPDDYFKKNFISENIIKAIIDGQNSSSTYQTLDDVFQTRHLVYPEPLVLLNGEIYGVLFVCSTSATTNLFVEKTIGTIILSCLWVLVATMVIVYFITDNIVSPLKTMSKAAKNFASGRFDVRVPVRGDDEVTELSIAFNNMAAILASKDEMNRVFLSNVSHDLKTPMQIISGYIEGILDGTIPEDRHTHYLNYVTNEISRLSKLVTSLLDITRIQAGELKFTKTNFDVCETARLVLIDSFEQKINEKKIDIEFTCDSENMYVYADKEAVHRILYNLCENAIKFTNESGLIRINITDRPKEKKIQVSVYNTGDGIPSEDLPYVFDRFYKSDRSRGLDKTGVGLGLFIIKTIIDAHEEKITVKSEYGKDCEFVFTLQKIHETSAKESVSKI